MKSVIKEIFYGNWNCDQIKSSEEYKRLMEEAEALQSIISEALPDDKKEILEKFCMVNFGLEAESADTHFIEGVKLGILLGVEACN